jgi:hypothetical protein
MQGKFPKNKKGQIKKPKENLWKAKRFEAHIFVLVLVHVLIHVHVCVHVCVYIFASNFM